METQTQIAGNPKWMSWTGRVLSALPILFIILGATYAFTHPEEVQKGFTKYGFPEGFMNKVLIIEVICLLLYIIPQTAVLGAILLTGYLGGAVITHARVGEPNWILAVILGVVFWLGLWFRDPRVRALAPIRRLS
jgi:DoxX-like family